MRPALLLLLLPLLPLPLVVVLLLLLLQHQLRPLQAAVNRAVTLLRQRLGRLRPGAARCASVERSSPLLVGVDLLGGTEGGREEAAAAAAAAAAASTSTCDADGNALARGFLQHAGPVGARGAEHDRRACQQQCANRQSPLLLLLRSCGAAVVDTT